MGVLWQIASARTIFADFTAKTYLDSLQTVNYQEDEFAVRTSSKGLSANYVERETAPRDCWRPNKVKIWPVLILIFPTAETKRRPTRDVRDAVRGLGQWRRRRDHLAQVLGNALYEFAAVGRRCEHAHHERRSFLMLRQPQLPSLRQLLSCCPITPIGTGPTRLHVPGQRPATMW